MTNQMKPGKLLPPPANTVMRLSPEAYEQLEKACPKCGSTSEPIDAGFMLGVQFVLKLLRDGFTVSRQ